MVEAIQSFAEFYEATFPAVYRATYLMCRDNHLAEDVAQDAFAKALARWSRLGGEPWAAGWVMRTALNGARRAHRWHQKMPTQEDRDGGQDVDSSIDLWKGIRSLPRRQQQAVILHYVNDLPVELVADVMGCRDGTVKAHLWRARQQLARYMEADEHA